MNVILNLERALALALEPTEELYLGSGWFRSRHHSASMSTKFADSFPRIGWSNTSGDHNSLILAKPAKRPLGLPKRHALARVRHGRRNPLKGEVLGRNLEA